MYISFVCVDNVVHAQLIAIQQFEIRYVYVLYLLLSFIKVNLIMSEIISEAFVRVCNRLSYADASGEKNCDTHTLCTYVSTFA